MAYEVPPLPYDYNALEPTIDEQTMHLHHDKHHQAYVNAANGALEGTEWADKPVEEVLQNLGSVPEDKRQVVRSLKDKLRAHYNVSVAELEETDLWQRATIGVVAISSSRDYLQGQIQQIEKQAVRIANDNGAEVVDTFVDYF